MAYFKFQLDLQDRCRNVCGLTVETSQVSLTLHRAENNGRSTDTVRPDRGLDRSNSGLAGHFDWSFLDTNILFSIQLLLNAQ